MYVLYLRAFTFKQETNHSWCWICAHETTLFEKICLFKGLDWILEEEEAMLLLIMILVSSVGNLNADNMQVMIHILENLNFWTSSFKAQLVINQPCV